MGKTVFVMLSGGVDSAVAAALLVERGFAVHGVFMVNWTVPLSPDAPCTWKQDWKDVQAIGKKLQIPVEKVNFEREYHAKVIDVFFKEYALGRTPNPDVLCNKEIKFGLFFDFAIKRGADYVATGHYARIKSETNSKFKLLKGLDPNKDQSYFLWALGQKQLQHTLFPIGELTKPQVRAKAKALGLPVAAKPDSQGICFVGPVKLPELLSTRLKPKPGPVITTDGAIVGTHRGIQFYTEGQRHGFGGGGSIPMYVVAKERATNTLIVAPGAEHPTLYSDALVATDCHWITKRPDPGWRGTAKIRYRQLDQEATITAVKRDRIVVHFAKPQRAITPGQSIVLYQGDELVGAGVIAERESVSHPREGVTASARVLN